MRADREELPAPDQPEPGPVAAVPVGIRSLALTVILVLLVVGGLRLAQSVLVPITFAVLISYALDPIVTALARRVSRVLAATLVMIALLAGTGWLAYSLRFQAAAMAGELPRAAERVRASIRQLQAGAGRDSPVNNVRQAAQTIEKAATEAAQGAAKTPGVQRVQVEQSPVRIGDVVLSGTLQAVEIGGQAVVVFFLALYLLAAGDLFKRKLVKMAGPTLSEKKVTLQILQDIDRQIAAFLLIRVVISVLVGVATWLALLLLGVPQAGVWGVAAAVLDVIPYAGPVLVTMGVAVVAFVQFNSWPMALAAAGLLSVVSVIEGYWLTPWLTSRAARMNNVAVFVGLLFWGWVWGAAGLLLAVPMLMVMKAVCDRIEGLQPVGELLGE